MGKTRASTNQFIENDDGVHMLNPRNAEFTLCGDAFDAPDSEKDWEGGEFKEARKRTVTCEVCAEIILACKAARVGNV